MKIFDEIRELNKGTNPEKLEKDIQEAIQAARKQDDLDTNIFISGLISEFYQLFKAKDNNKD